MKILNISFAQLQKEVLDVAVAPAGSGDGDFAEGFAIMGDGADKFATVRRVAEIAEQFEAVDSGIAEALMRAAEVQPTDVGMPTVVFPGFDLRPTIGLTKEEMQAYLGPDFTVIGSAGVNEIGFQILGPPNSELRIGARLAHAFREVLVADRPDVDELLAEAVIIPGRDQTCVHFGPLELAEKVA